MDNVWIGSYKIRANISCFSDQIVNLVARVQKEGRISNQALRKENISFIDALRSNHPQKLALKESGKSSGDVGGDGDSKIERGD